jgi:hypothetical protein
VNKTGLPVWKLAYSFSVYIILRENKHQYLFAAADNSPWNVKLVSDPVPGKIKF